MLAPRLRRGFGVLRRTFLHPQWLLGGRDGIASLVVTNARGLVLDIGCNDRWVEKSLSPGCRYIGIDYLVTGRDIYGSRPDIYADASTLPIADASIDTVLILDVVEHLSKPREALNEISRVLRPNGRLLLEMPFLYPIHDAPHDYQRFTAHGLVREMEAVGLRVDSLVPSIGAAETAGLVSCLTVSGMAVQILQKRSFGVLLLPMLALSIPIINIVAWSLGRLLPSWDAVAAGYRLTATKA
jgi:SAM-dependent methyltransferase